MNRIEEKEAYLILQCLWNKFSNDFYSSESPDLKNDIENIGIEVTQSTLDMKERLFYIANKMHLKPNSMTRKDLEVISFYDKDDLCKEYEEQKLNNETEIEMFSNTKELITTKINKFNNTYVKYNTNGLFVFLRSYPLTTAHIEELCNYFNCFQKGNNHTIDLLFLHNIDNLYIYQKSTNHLETIIIDEDTKNIIYNIL